MNKKGVADQTIIFILALVIAFAAIIVFAFIFTGVFSNKEQVDMRAMQSQIEAGFSGLSYGAAKQITVQVPGQATRVCFYDPNEREGKTWDFNSGLLKEIGAQGYNVFALNKETILGNIKIKGIRMADKYVLCCNTGIGALNILAEGWEYGTILVSCR